MIDILLSAPYMLPFVKRFQPAFDRYGIHLIIANVAERLSANDLMDYAGQFDGTICGDDAYTAPVLQACAPRLKVISKWGTGIDSFDQQAAKDLGIKICNTKDAFTSPVADSVLGYLLAFARKQPWLDKAMKSGEWKKIIGKSLSECTLGVVGVGHIGKAVLQRASVFGMCLLGNDIVEISIDFLSKYSIEMTKLDNLLTRSDFISLNCDLNPTSWHLINESTLKHVNSQAVIINTARGHLIDEPSLVRALLEKRIAGAALDVFEVEPLPKESPLLKMDNVMLAPHNCNSSPAAWNRVHWNTIRNLLMAMDIPCNDLNDFIEADLAQQQAGN